MNIQLAASLNAPGVASVRTGGNGPNRGGPRSSRGSPRGGRRGGMRGPMRRFGKPRQPKENKTAAELDAELDAHNAKMQTD